MTYKLTADIGDMSVAEAQALIRAIIEVHGPTPVDEVWRALFEVHGLPLMEGSDDDAFFVRHSSRATTRVAE